MKTIREIIDLMEAAEDYSDLYSAANEIKDSSLREEVSSAIAEYKELDTPVDEAYSCVTSDLLDFYMYEDNIENLTESKSKKTEGIDDKVYEVADKVAEKIKGTGSERVSMEELDEIVSDTCKELGVKEYDDLDADIRGILAYKGLDTDFETGEIIVVTENKKVTEKRKLSPEDEAHFNDEIDKIARQEIEDKFKNDKKKPDEEVEKEMDKITEGKDFNTSDICKWVKESIKDLVQSDEGCCEYKLDDDLSIFCGWSDGYDPEDKDGIHSKENQSWCLNIGIKCNHEYMKTDFDWLNAPYNEETGEVWDTNMTLDKDGIDETDAQWLIEQYKEIREALDKGEIILENKEKKTEAREEVSFPEIIEMMETAEDYADLYSACSYIKNENIRVDAEILIGECEDDGDDVETAYSIVTSDILDPYYSTENVPSLVAVESKKVTESNGIDNSDEEDLATMLYAEAMDYASFDRDGKCTDYEIQDLEEVQDWYDSSVTEETYNKVVGIVKNVIDNIKFYNDSEGTGTYIELNDNHTLWEVEAPKEVSNDGSFDMVYSDIVNEAANKFQEETDTKLFLVGRMGRHACVENNFTNASRYNELQEVQEKLEKEVIEKANAYLNGNLEEGKKVTESAGNYSNILKFAQELQGALRNNGYNATFEDVGDDEQIAATVEKDGVELGIGIYLGVEDGMGAYGYEEDTIGLGGDCMGETIYPLYVKGWDYETGTPSGSPIEGREVYAMFNEIDKTSVEEVVSIVNKTFDERGQHDNEKNLQVKKDTPNKEFYNSDTTEFID